MTPPHAFCFHHARIDGIDTDPRPHLLGKCFCVASTAAFVGYTAVLAGRRARHRADIDNAAAGRAKMLRRFLPIADRARSPNCWWKCSP